MDIERTYTVFAGDRLIASGGLEKTLLQTKKRLDRGESDRILIFDDHTGQQVDFNFQGTPEEVLARAAPAPKPAGPGRPKLGVVSREVSLLPRHWEWLEQQPNGSSAALRRLIEEASKRDPGKQRARIARNAASRVMSVMAGNLPDFEEASRALFAPDQKRFEQLIRPWPKDIRKHFERLSREVARLESEPSPSSAEQSTPPL